MLFNRVEAPFFIKMMKIGTQRLFGQQLESRINGGLHLIATGIGFFPILLKHLVPNDLRNVGKVEIHVVRMQ